METKLYDPLYVVTKTLTIQVQQVPGVVVEEHDKHQEHANGKTNFAEASDSKFESGNHRHGGAGGHTPDDDDLVGGRDLNV